jgi:hypothetical protein
VGHENLLVGVVSFDSSTPRQEVSLTSRSFARVGGHQRLWAVHLGDITTHSNFIGDGRPGTFGSGNARDKIDYLLLSPALFDKVSGGKIWRLGVWGAKNGTLFPHYDTHHPRQEAASDHAALYADISLE